MCHGTVFYRKNRKVYVYRSYSPSLRGHARGQCTWVLHAGVTSHVLCGFLWAGKAAAKHCASDPDPDHVPNAVVAGVPICYNQRRYGCLRHLSQPRSLPFDLGCVVMRKTSTRAPWAWLSLNHAYKPAHVNLFILFLFRPGGACRSFN